LAHDLCGYSSGLTKQKEKRGRNMKVSSRQLLQIHLLAVALLFISKAVSGQTVDTYLVSDFDSGNVQVFSVANNQLLKTIQTGAIPQSALVSADGRLAYVPNDNGVYLSIVDLTIGAEIVRLPEGGDLIFGNVGAITPDGNKVLLNVGPRLMIMNTSDFSFITVPLGTVCDDAAHCDSNPADIHIQKIAVAGNKAYLNLFTSFPVRVVCVDLNTLNVSQVPGTANAMNDIFNSITVSPDGRFVIANRVSPRALSVIDTSTNTVVQTLTPSIFPRRIVATTPGGAAGGIFIYLVGEDSFSELTVQAFTLNSGILTLAGSASLFPFTNSFSLSSVLHIALSPDSTLLYVGTATTVTAVNTQAIISNPAGALVGQFAVANLIDGIAGGSVQLQPPATAPTVTSVTPNLILSSDTDAGRTIHISGTNFSPDALLRIGNLPPFAPGAASDIQAIVPAGTAAQVADLIVTDPNSSSVESSQHQSGILRGQFVIASPPTFQPVNQVVVGNFGNSTAAILNVSTNISLQPAIPGALGAVGVAITSDGERAYIGQFQPAAVNVFNLVQNQREASILLDSNGLMGQTDGIVFSPSSPFGGAVVYAVVRHMSSDGHSGQELFVIDADPSHAGSTLNTILTTQLAGQELPPFRYSGAAGATPDGRYVYTNALQGFDCQLGWLIIFDMVSRSTNTILASTLNVNPCQLHIGLSPDGKFLLLNGVDDGIHIFDISVDPLNPAPVGVMIPQPPLNFSLFSFPTLHIPASTPNRLFAYDSTQNVVAAFNFDPVTPNFSQLGLVSIPGPGDTGGGSIGITPDGRLLYAPLSSEDDVAVLDTALVAQSNPAALITKISTGLSPLSVSVRPGTPTALSTAGNPVVNVVPTQGISIAFSDVTSAGATTATTTNVTPFSAPAGFQISSLPVYYEIGTTAAFSNAVVCMQYNPALVPSPESALRLAHYNSAIDPVTNQVIGWEDVTIPGSPDATTHNICGQVSTFSPFVIGIASVDFLFSSLLADISTLPTATTPAGIMRSLRAKALAARSSAGKGNKASAKNQLGALINQLQALVGNQVRTSDANTLISEANAILSTL
jgi:hypothetical protein